MCLQVWLVGLVIQWRTEYNQIRCLQAVALAAQLQGACLVAALYQDLCQTVEGGDAESLAVFSLRMVFAQVHRIAVAYAEDAAIAL